jgi:CBS domain-containing protein
MRVKEMMTKQVVVCREEDSLELVAKQMRDHDIGDVLIVDDAREVLGIVTDRDIVVRAVAAGLDLKTTPAVLVCTRHLETVTGDADVVEAIARMRDKAIRRIPVVEDGRLVGILSIGDVAETRDSDSALGQISAAPPNN